MNAFLKDIKKENLIFIILMLFVLYLSSFYNYLLFHTMAEIFSICIAFTVFILTWNSVAYIKNNYLLFVGTAYLFIGLLDFFHTMSYKGMQIFSDYDYYANQLWIATRYMESITLVIAFLYMNRQKQINTYLLFGIYMGITGIILSSIFVWKIFPICFIEDVGQTTFKKMSEYTICMILGIAVYLLNRNRNKMDKEVYRLLSWSIVFTIISELAFAFYVSNYGLSNLIGHYFKIFSFYFIYKAIIQKGVLEPYELIFRELKANEKKLNIQNQMFRNQAIVDGLTGLYNHRYLYEKLEEERYRVERYASNLSIILLDIDHFKKVNDTFGHVAGDEIIKAISGIIKKNIRVSDIAGRYGGEEFLIILPETDLQRASYVAEKIRVEVEQTTYIQGIRVTISGGVSQYQGEKTSELVKSADNKLYNAKNRGRNKIQSESIKM